MAALNELIQKIENPELRAQIQEAADRLVKQKKFGLVFEEHLPECTPLYDIPVRKGAKVSLRNGKANETFTVLKIEDGVATCLPKNSKEAVQFAVTDLVTTAELGDPIYPCLQPLGEVCNAPDSELWHTLIEADNYHALQLLEYLYAGKVDCIYIDPPYNTRDKDWKAKLYDGTYSIIGYNEDGSVITSEAEQIERNVLPSTQWQISAHDATHYGTRLIKKFIPGRDFAYPKSLYAVRDCIRFFVANKPNALIVDFFAGSGTTLHAVNLLNAEDDGHRRCIMVTNNEVSNEEAKTLTAKGFRPGDDEWNALGIARHVTWPRTVCSITGRDINGNIIKPECA